MNDSGATPLTMNDGTYMVKVNAGDTGVSGGLIAIEPNTLTIYDNETFNGKLA